MFTKVHPQTIFTCDGCGREETVPAIQLVAAHTFLPQHWRAATIFCPASTIPPELAMELCPQCTEKARAALRGIVVHKKPTISE
jgi:hypothetical protein